MKRKVSSIALCTPSDPWSGYRISFCMDDFFILQGKSGDHGSGAASPSAEIHH